MCVCVCVCRLVAEVAFHLLELLETASLPPIVTFSRATQLRLTKAELGGKKAIKKLTFLQRTEEKVANQK